MTPPPLGASPGYVSATDEIPGWTLSGTLGGLNPTGSGDAPLADNGDIPNGKRVAFLQGAISISTTITELSPGTRYVVSFRANSADSFPAPTAEWSIGGAPFTAIDLTGAPVGDDSPYLEVSAEFDAASTSTTLVIRQTADTDAILLIDDVQIETASP